MLISSLIVCGVNPPSAWAGSFWGHGFSYGSWCGRLFVIPQIPVFCFYFILFFFLNFSYCCVCWCGYIWSTLNKIKPLKQISSWQWKTVREFTAVKSLIRFIPLCITQFFSSAPFWRTIFDFSETKLMKTDQKSVQSVTLKPADRAGDLAIVKTADLNVNNHINMVSLLSPQNHMED